MTERQRVYVDLARQGHSIEQIAEITHRSTNAVLHALKLARAKSCKTPGNCEGCPLLADCEGIVIPPLRRLTLPKATIERRGRYSY